MIVRIATEGQYELADEDVETLNELDNETVAACDSTDEEGFHANFEKLLDLVRTKGRPLNDDELEESEVILPPPDVSLEEAKADFSGDGLIPG